MADAPDSKSGRGNPVWVQVPPPAPSDYQPGHFSVLSRYPKSRAAVGIFLADGLSAVVWPEQLNC
jgi:hypothetical protein